MSTYGLSADGYTAPRYADYLTIIRTRYEQALVALGYTQMPDWERDLFLGQTSEIMAYLLDQQSEGNQAVYDARSPSNATGIQLDNLALIVGVRRSEATYSTVSLTCTGTNGTVITQGKIVEGGGTAGDARWIITSDATISGGTATVTARAQEKGEIVATAGQIDAIVTAVAGWTAVTNAAAATPGSARETDSELRARRQRRLQAAGSTSTNAILSALLGVEGVDGAVVADNITGESVTEDGIAMDPYSVACVVTPSTMGAAVKALVVAAIFSKLGGGTATSGNQTGTVTKRDGRTHTIKYYFAADVTVAVAWTLVMEPGYVAADVEEELAALVLDYFLTLAPGDTVYPSPLIALAMTIDGIANVTSLLLAGGAIPVPMNANQQPTLGAHTVA